MKTKLLLIVSLFACFPLFSNYVVKPRRAFDKGSLLISISEGSTTARYSTTYTGETNLPTTRFSNEMDGIRDPLFIEFGLSRRWGIGLSSGADIFHVNTKNYYNMNSTPGSESKVTTSEFTFDVNYHIYTSAKKDLSVYGSVGAFGLSFNGMDGDQKVNYEAKGGIMRFGLKYRYYFFKRLGALVMVSAYSADAAPVKEKTSSPYSTSLNGEAFEFGLCFRIF